MGVTGSGKTTIGELLARSLGWTFHDGDDFHPPENKNKMAGGTPLADEDRIPWLQNLNKLLSENAHENTPVILACSALKQAYRAILSEGIPGLHFVHLDGTFECIQKRLSERKDHFMDPDLLTSQFQALEPAGDAVSVSIEETPEEIVQKILNTLAVP